MVFLHLFYDFNEAVIEGGCEVGLLTVLLFERGEAFDVCAMFPYHGIAEVQDIHNLLIDRLAFVLWHSWGFPSFANRHA